MKSFDEWKESKLDEQGKAPAAPAAPAEAPAEAPVAEEDPHAALEKGEIATYLKLVQRAAGIKGLYSPGTVMALKKAIQSDPVGITNFLKVLGNMKVGQQARLTKGVAKI